MVPAGTTSTLAAGEAAVAVSERVVRCNRCPESMSFVKLTAEPIQLDRPVTKTHEFKIIDVSD